jgi:Ser/Thr protein kinase RdoA (MazF antagonist)
MTGHRTEMARPYLHAAATAAGLSPTGAEPIRLAENDLWRLPCGIVVRISRAGQDAAAFREVAVTRWLATHDFPAVRPLPLTQPLTAADRPATYWYELPPHHAGTAADLAPLLHRLHNLPVPQDLPLGEADPFVRIRERLAAARSLNPADRDFLLTRLDRLRDAWDDLPPGQPPCVIHGDAWGGNCAVTEDGQATLLDFERTALGRPEWDLTSTAIALETTGTLTADGYQAFCSAYGHDVRDWPGYPTLRAIRELRMVTFAFQIADQDPAALPQARYRIACLHGEHGPRPWHWTAAA